MALVNPNIAMSFRAPEIQQPNMLADYAAIQQIQGGRQAQEMNALKMQEAQAALQERNALRQLNPAAADYENQLFRVNPTLGIAYRKEAAATAAQQAAATASQAAAAKSGFDLKAAQRKFGDDLKRSLSSNPSDENIIAFGQDALIQGLYTPEQVESTVAQLLALPLPDRTRVLSQAGASAADLKPPAPAAPPSMVAEYTFAKTPDGGGFKGSFQDFVTARAAAGRAPAAPRPDQPPVAVVDPVTGKPVYVTREQALSGKMTPANAMEGLAPKEIQAREAKYPAATSAVKTFESSADKLAADLDKLATHPGLSGISGLIYGRTPAITKDARAAQSLYDSIVARGGFQELQNMRASSPTGGALGNVSNQEGQYLRDAFAPINRTQDTTDLSQSLKDAAVATRTSKQRVRDAYDMTYDYKTQGKAPAPALSPIDKQALEWANSNSADPRAAAIKQRLGM